VAAAL
jgi:hypothetical protein